MTHVNDKPARSAAEVNYDSVARVASVVQLRDVVLRSSRCGITVPAASVPPSWATDAFVGFDTSAGRVDSEKDAFTIEADFVVVYKESWKNEVLTELPKLDPEDPPDVEIQASFELLYSARNAPSFTGEELESFAIANGTLHAWPYWREFADSAAHRMQLPRLMIGVFKLPSSHDPSEGSRSSAGEGETP